MPQATIFILSGPSGSGKTTLYRKLLSKKNIKTKIAKVTSFTTRERRVSEKNGRDYHFISHKMFLFKKRHGHFLETQKVFNHYYGTPKKGVREILQKGKSVLLCIEFKGARMVLRSYPLAVTIFVKTKSMADLKKRLRLRASENKQNLKIRIVRAEEELREAANYKYIICNDKIQVAVKELEQIILKEMLYGKSSPTEKYFYIKALRQRSFF